MNNTMKNEIHVFSIPPSENKNFYYYNFIHDIKKLTAIIFAEACFYHVYHARRS